tara:strand:- start:2461 stop:3375 length:915 start_codon:yes stop_codon:yes gene_type:complete
MGFLKNDGDIILDAVLTDTGRMRLARGDGGFRIAKFAFGDDEIDYALYNKNHPSGSAYYDLTILQTPVLEAFTNNTSTMNSKLVSIGQKDILYLPVMQLNTIGGATQKNGNGAFTVAVDKNTVDNLVVLGSGLLNGYIPADANAYIRVDQGLNTSQISKETTLAPNLVEHTYLIEMDNRLGMLSSREGPGPAPSYIDDDNIASYTVSMGGGAFVTDLGATVDSPIAGPRGTTVALRLAASRELATSTYLFEKNGSLGVDVLANDAAGGSTLAASSYRFIDSTVRVTGLSTGYRIDVPVRYVKSV